MEMSDKNISHTSVENRCAQCFCGDARNRVRIILARALARFLQNSVSISKEKTLFNGYNLYQCLCG